MCDSDDADDDNDGCLDESDANPLSPSADLDGDGSSDDCDDCLGNDAMGDRDTDRICDDLDDDDDGDGCPDLFDPSPLVFGDDADGNGVADDCLVIDPAEQTRFAVEEDYTCRLEVDGSATCWGSTEYGIWSPPGDTFEQLHGASAFVCALDAAGEATCWGDPFHDAVNDVPEVAFTSLSIGDFGACGILSTGHLLCWGGAASAAPSGTFVKASVGSHHACGIRTNQEAICWGDNQFGEATAPLGSFYDVVVSDGSASNWSCALRPDGQAVCWGRGVALPPDVAMISLSMGRGHACGQHSDGTVSCWTGGGVPVSDAYLGLTTDPVSAYWTGESKTCFLSLEGALQCVGSDRFGSSVPPDGEFTVMDVTASPEGLPGGCAIADSGEISCWGVASDYSVPTDISAVALSIGFLPHADVAHGCAVSAFGEVQCWGGLTYAPEESTWYHDVDVGFTGTGVCATTMGHTWCTLSTISKYLSSEIVGIGDGQIYYLTNGGEDVCRTWGSTNGSDLCVDPLILPNQYSQLSVGYNHICGLRLNGLVDCDGLTPPTSQFVRVLSGHSTACGELPSGEFECWGEFFSPGPPAPGSPMPGENWQDLWFYTGFACGISLSGEQRCWGSVHR